MAVYKCMGKDRGVCDYEAPERWLGRCPQCRRNYNCQKFGIDGSGKSKTSFAALAIKEVKRISTGIPEVDHVLGGGLVRGSTVLISGPPKQGKTTLLVQVAKGVSKHGRVLYASGEQSAEDVGQFVFRTQSQSENIELLGNCGDVYKITEAAEESEPLLIIVDSLQTASLDDCEAAEGSATQVKEVVNYLTAFGKRENVCIIVICHVNKEGDLAGPKAIEHLVDTLVEFHPYYEFDEDSDDYEEETLLRELSSSANRNAAGPGTVRAMFEMTAEGIKPKKMKKKKSRLTLVREDEEEDAPSD